MTDNQIKIITLYDNADERGQELILNILVCAGAFGEPFYKELQEALDKGDKIGMLEVIAKYTAILKERATV